MVDFRAKKGGVFWAKKVLKFDEILDSKFGVSDHIF